MNLSIWTCSKCGQANGKGKLTCRCGTPKPTEFEVEIDGKKEIIGTPKKNQTRKAGYDAVTKKQKADQRKKTYHNVKNLPDAPEGQIFQSAMKGRK